MIVVDVAGPKAAGWQTARKGSPAESSFPGKIWGEGNPYLVVNTASVFGSCNCV